MQDALSLQSQLALLIRDEGLVREHQPINDWDMWVRYEGSIRTMLIAYCYFNLCSIAYNSPPVLVTSEISMILPSPSKLWRAENAWQWREARQSIPHVEISFQDALTRLLGRQNGGSPNTLSTLGNYVMIHALIQHIYFVKQTSFASPQSPFANMIPYDNGGLREQDVEQVTQALRSWQAGFEEHRMRISQAAQQMGNDANPGGPVAFDATALSRLAHIRLHTDLSPARALESRDPYIAANIFNNMPLLPRGPRLNKAILQAVHALAMLVKAGINYIARTKSLEWSMQHSCEHNSSFLSPGGGGRHVNFNNVVVDDDDDDMCEHDCLDSPPLTSTPAVCNLECAVLLAKWLITLASMGPTQVLTPEEKSILASIKTIVDETEYAVPIDPSLTAASTEPLQSAHHHLHQGRNDASLNDSAKLRQLASAVLRIWAKTFKGEHIFELVKTMGHGLEVYSNIIDKPRGQGSLGRTSITSLD